MRDILFRGKRADDREWVYGYYICKQDPLPPRIDTNIIVTFDENSMSVWNKVDPETIGQYTGLKDINENKVFEGDVVMFDTQMWSPPDNEKLVGVVKYGLAHIDASDPYEWEEYYGFYVSCKSNSTGDGSYFEEPITPNVEFEVIGNIFDNHELWEE